MRLSLAPAPAGADTIDLGAPHPVVSTIPPLSLLGVESLGGVKPAIIRTYCCSMRARASGCVNAKKSPWRIACSTCSPTTSGDRPVAVRARAVARSASVKLSPKRFGAATRSPVLSCQLALDTAPKRRCRCPATPSPAPRTTQQRHAWSSRRHQSPNRSESRISCVAEGLAGRAVYARILD